MFGYFFLFTLTVLIKPAASLVEFVVNLHRNHDKTISQAYSHAVGQFRSLRAEQYYATQFGIMEAEEFGAIFGPTEIQKGFIKERGSLDSWEQTEKADIGAQMHRSRWSSRHDKPASAGWTRGEEYVRLWQEDIRPTWAPEPLEEAVAYRMQTIDPNAKARATPQDPNLGGLFNDQT